MRKSNLHLKNHLAWHLWFSLYNFDVLAVWNFQGSWEDMACSWGQEGITVFKMW